jgi:glycosyltransferase involved in cell wall biosynthesis
MKILSIIVPVYFNEASLPILFKQMQDVEVRLLEKGVGLDLIFVDDGSEDRSFDALMDIKKIRPTTQIIKLTRNFGAVHASKAGFQYVKGDCFMILAADLQDPPDIVLSMVDFWMQGKSFVIARRADRRDPVMTRFFASIYYFILKRMVVKDYPTGGFDLFLLDKAFLPHMQSCAKNINPNLYAYSLGTKPEVMTYTRQKRRFGKSRWTFKKKVVFFLDSILGLSMAPLRFIMSLGICVSIISFLYGGWITTNALLYGLPVAGYATIVTLISFLLSLIIIMLGMIGEYLWRILDEVNQRPEFVIEKIL